MFFSKKLYSYRKFKKFTGKNLESLIFLREFFVSNLEDNTLSSLAFKQELLYSITKNGDEAKYL